jgi:hypothetical protein
VQVKTPSGGFVSNSFAVALSGDVNTTQNTVSGITTFPNIFEHSSLTVTANASGYNVTPAQCIIASLGQDTTIVFTATSQSTGITSGQQNAVLVSPNLVVTVLNIIGSKDGELCKLYSIAGQLLLETPQTSIDVSDLPGGIYFLQVGKITVKIVMKQ